MAFRAEIETTENLDLVARVLRDLGDKDLQRELYRGLNRVTSELKNDARREAGQRLPSRGGLAGKVAKSRLATKRVYGSNPGLKITAAGMKQLPQMDQGTVKHPVHGNRSVWVTQSITGGWFTEPMFEGRDEIRSALDDLLEDLAQKAARKIQASS